VEDRFCYDFN